MYAGVNAALLRVLADSWSQLYVSCSAADELLCAVQSHPQPSTSSTSSKSPTLPPSGSKKGAKKASKKQQQQQEQQPPLMTSE
jgi:hypothetical protein